jgi:hypothetical protein
MYIFTEIEKVAFGGVKIQEVIIRYNSFDDQLFVLLLGN